MLVRRACMAILSCSVFAKTAPSRAQCVFFAFSPAGRIHEARVSEKQKKHGLRLSKHTLRQGAHFEKLTFLQRLTLRNLVALTWLWTLGLLELRVSRHSIRQGIHIEKLRFLRHSLEKTVTDDIALDLPSCFSRCKNTLRAKT